MSAARDSESGTSAAVRAEAERWHARLRGSEHNPKDWLAFAEWRDASPLHARAYAETQALWSEVGYLAGDSDMLRWRREAHQAALGGSAKRGTGMNRRRRALGASAIAAAVMLAVGVVLVMHGERYSTALGEQRTVTLADGSTVLLNTDSEIVVRMGSGYREVRLARGEALFTVKHEAARPFRTIAGDDVITDLGTRFAVRLQPNASRVEVLEGKVAVTRGVGRTATLAAGETIGTREGDWRIQSAPAESFARWAEGRLVFHDAPLSEVVAEVNRYGPERFVLGDESLGGLRVEGDFRIGHPRVLAVALEAALPVHVERSGNELRLIRRD
ncbi:MAG: FecR domain-containing protein [Gammaproteobacteria bacterium]